MPNGLPEGWHLETGGEGPARLLHNGTQVAAVAEGPSMFTGRLTAEGQAAWVWSAPRRRDVVIQVIAHLGGDLGEHDPAHPRWYRMVKAIRGALEEYHGLTDERTDEFALAELRRLRERVDELEVLLVQAEDYAREQGEDLGHDVAEAERRADAAEAQVRQLRETLAAVGRLDPNQPPPDNLELDVWSIGWRDALGAVADALGITCDCEATGEPCADCPCVCHRAATPSQVEAPTLHVAITDAMVEAAWEGYWPLEPDAGKVRTDDDRMRAALEAALAVGVASKPADRLEPAGEVTSGVGGGEVELCPYCNTGFGPCLCPPLVAAQPRDLRRRSEVASGPPFTPPHDEPDCRCEPHALGYVPGIPVTPGQRYTATAYISRGETRPDGPDLGECTICGGPLAGHEATPEGGAICPPGATP